MILSCCHEVSPLVSDGVQTEEIVLRDEEQGKGWNVEWSGASHLYRPTYLTSAHKELLCTGIRDSDIRSTVNSLLDAGFGSKNGALDCHAQVWLWNGPYETDQRGGFCDV